MIERNNAQQETKGSKVTFIRWSSGSMYKAKKHQEKQLVGGGGKMKGGVPNFFLGDVLHDDTKWFMRIMFWAWN